MAGRTSGQEAQVTTTTSIVTTSALVTASVCTAASASLTTATTTVSAIRQDFTSLLLYNTCCGNTWLKNAHFNQEEGCHNQIFLNRLFSIGLNPIMDNFFINNYFERNVQVWHLLTLLTHQGTLKLCTLTQKLALLYFWPQKRDITFHQHKGEIRKTYIQTDSFSNYSRCTSQMTYLDVFWQCV